MLRRIDRDERWKLIRYPQVDKTQLFDLENDPQEATNLADLPQHAGKVAELTARLQQAQSLAGDKAPLTVANPKPAAWTPPAQASVPQNKSIPPEPAN